MPAFCLAHVRPSLLLLVALLLGCSEATRNELDEPAGSGEPGCVRDGDCDPGEVCAGGTCVADEEPEGTDLPSACTGDGDCPDGQTCAGGVCRAPFQPVGEGEVEEEGQGEVEEEGQGESEGEEEGQGEGEGEEEGQGEGEGDVVPPLPECEPDGLEPNDVPAAAVLLNELELGGVSLCSRDEDWYRIMLQRGDGILVTVHGAGLQVELRAPDGLGVVGMSTPGPDGAQTGRGELPASGGYLIRVWGRVVSSYSMQLEIVEAPDDPLNHPEDPPDDPVAPPDDPVTPPDDPEDPWNPWNGGGESGSCVDDRYEQNDSQARARPVQPGIQQGLMICPNDDDWYSLHLRAGSTIAVFISFDLFTDLDLILLDANGRELASSMGIFLPYEELTYTADVEKDVFVQVTGFLGSQSQYTMEIEVEQGPEPLDPGDDNPPLDGCHDRYEPNASSVEAAVLEPGSYALAICPGQDDWFSFQLAHSGPVRVEMVPGPGTGDLDLAVGDEELYALGYSEEVAGVAELVDLPDAPAGKIYIVVYGYTAEDAGAYTLNLEY